MANNSILANMAVRIAANTAQFNTGLNQATTQLNKFQNTITTAARSFVAGFGAMQVASFALDVSKLAGEAEGVRAAFEKLPNSVELMNDLKMATAGTVSELDLMKRAVMASNFGISLNALPQLLEFASVRAKQTGQSVDYLVDSIVTGIGRKSKLILDNLGISAVQLTEALGGASTAAASIGDVADAVGKIASSELERMGSMSENASTKLERLSANWVNLKVAIGDAANGTGILGSAINGLNSDMVKLTDTMNMGFKDALVSAFPFLEDILGKVRTAAEKAAEAQRRHAIAVIAVDKAFASGNAENYINSLKDNEYLAEIMVEYNNRIIKTEKEKATSIENIANLTERLNSLQTDQLTLTGKQLMETNKEIKSIEDKIKKLKELGLEIDKQNSKDKEAANRRSSVTVDNFSSSIPSVNNFDTSKIKFSPDNVSGIISTQEAITRAIEIANQKQREQVDIIMMQRQAWANLGSTMSDVISQTIASGEPLKQSLSRIAAVVINQLEQITLARMVADSARYGIGGILAAAAGFGVVKGLFNRIARNNPVQTTNSLSYGGSSVRMSGAQNSTSIVRGQDIYISGQNYQKYNRSTAFIG
jgi:hypothetical protein